jgi:hypothetical protein
MTQQGLVAQGLEHCTGVTGSWVQSPAGSLLLICLCDPVWNTANSYSSDATAQYHVHGVTLPLDPFNDTWLKVDSIWIVQ